MCHNDITSWQALGLICGVWAVWFAVYLRWS
jgi:hypothetical protein